MQLHKDSHLDHGLTQGQLDFLLAAFVGRTAFFVETIELPTELGTVPCSLYGPSMDDEPVPEVTVSYAQREGRSWPTRFLLRPMRPTRRVTVVAGPHDGQPCVLYTAYGGAAAPQEPGDPGCRDRAASEAFWAQHALAWNSGLH